MGRTAKKKDKKETVKEKLRQRKKESKKNKHRARLIVRNLPFATTEENLRLHFEQFGEVEEVTLLKKEDGKLLGCGFVQFTLVQKAAKARHHLNGKPFLDRNIECAFALSKTKYTQQQNKVQIKTEPVDDGYENVIKTEPPEDSKKTDSKQESGENPASHNINATMVDATHDDLENNSKVRPKEDEHKEEIDDEDEKEVYDKNDEEIEDADEKEVYDEEMEDVDEKDFNRKKPFVQSNDATEGKTIFIRNVPFTATNDDVKHCFSQFGPLFYALVCIDPLTEHSKGTAFVKFRNKKDADECLATPNITLMENTLECKYAVTRDELKRSKEDSSNKSRERDSRNLYLMKEGVVLAGSKAAEGVSASDMAKRLQVEQYKHQMLKNLNMFVARTRLIVHNVPPSWDDSKLRALFKKYSSPTATIKEARIMRNMRILDSKGVGNSKEYAFVTFTTHEAALEALRSINNNPNVFTPSKRPIVAFSIENRAKLQAKERRLHNSQIKNPINKMYNSNTPKLKQRKKNKESVQSNTDISEKETPQFSGVTATPGVKKMRSRFNLRTQAQMHHAQLKKEKKNKKFAKKTLQQKQAEFTKQPRQKINKTKNKDGDNFSKLVSEYKKKLFNPVSVQEKKKKWFE